MKKSTLSAFAITFSLSGNSIFTGAFSPSPTKKLPPSNSQKTDKTSLPYASDFDHCQAIGICGYLPTELLQSEIEAAQEKIEAFAHGFALSRLKETKNPEQTDEDDKITFMKNMGTNIHVHYGNDKQEDASRPASIKGWFDMLKDMAENEAFANIHVDSSGAKNAESWKRKISKNPEKKIYDLARVMVVTDNPKDLYDFCNYAANYNQQEGGNSIFKVDEDNPIIFRKWNRNGSGFTSGKVLVPIKTDQCTIYSEFMFRPEHKHPENDVLTHTAYEVARKTKTDHYNPNMLRKWNLVMRELKQKSNIPIEKIVNKEVRTENGYEPLTTKNTHLYNMMHLFSNRGKNHDAPILRRQDEMKAVQKKINDDDYALLTSQDYRWTPLSLKMLDNEYRLPQGIYLNDSKDNSISR